MREDHETVLSLIVRCFNASEMDYLRQQARFQVAVAAMNTFDDFEAVTDLGQRLLFNRDRRNRGMHSLLPMSRRDARFPLPTPA